ncbi:prolyl oligopeptidase . Serine peptidase. MEROPS family S09A [Nannocystis exedens]|uniref:prolyl oligopeptidase n=1 Tax=Nannocystis exedens TaxID=54 RepID=A0A1I2AYB4_9BACT|nr:prolyl oligopeptidase family serine peptidase [Nannocystis exedens]PCC74343.1 peptidase S9 [Nannocystis exedens]SFE48737.1 prolyl oligopeptidase . Serine peptidase. MEROPS family S09A [Nannocystis exedens]
MARSSLFAVTVALLGACTDSASAPALPGVRETCDDPPPATRRQDLVETIHDTPVADPYRWLEVEGDPEVKAWMTAQDDYARERLQALPRRDAIAARLGELLDIDAMSAPYHRGGIYFYTRRHKGVQKPIYYLRRGEHGREEVLLDPNKLSPDGSVAVHGIFPDFAGRLVAYKLSRNNADASTLYLRDLASGHDLPDVIEGARYASPAWTPDGSGFYYVWLPTDPSIPPSELPGHAEVRFHRVGEPAAKDSIVAPATGDPSRFVGVGLSRDGRWLFLHHQHGWTSSDVYLRDLHAGDTAWKPLVVGRRAIYDVTAWRDRFYVHTNDGAPRYRVFEVDPRNPAREDWKLLVPETDATLEGLQVVGERLVLAYLRDAHSAVVVRGLDGSFVRELPLPGLGSAGGLVGNPDEDRAYFSFSSFTEPSQIFETSIATGATRLWQRIDLPVDTSRFVVEQVRYPSKDGTPISMFVVRRRDLPLSADAPALLTGYGGFSVSMTPAFSARAVVWLEHGGVFAVPNLRGGGEYGEDWHRAGMREHKQNVFDDFAAAARALVERGYTRHERLAIMGGSNGGLLVGATMVQHPELARAAACAVPLLDMVRYTQFGAGKTWIPEYGDPEDPRDFAYIYPYSPYHHVTAGTRYPAMLMLAADSDDRVDPMHARKFTAQIQHASKRPAWLRIESNAGHGGADLLHQTIAREADTLAFLLHHVAP